MRGDVLIPARRSPGLVPSARPSRRTTTVLLGTASALAAFAVSGTPASAAWAPGAFPASSAGSVLADDFSDGSLISGDGRFVVFRTAASVLLGTPPDPDEVYSQGVVRKDLLTGDVQVVAPPQRVLRATGAAVGNGTRSVQGISRDGRFVLITTSARLSPDDAASNSPDVYLRDMDQPASGGAAYELVSARDGGTDGAEYADPNVGSDAGLPGYALSADGRRVVFVTRGVSNLPAADGATTPAQQVWLRDLDARTTRLISREKTDDSPAGTPSPQPPASAGSSPPTVAISADGTAVVWTAGDAQRQTPTAPREGPIGAQPTLLWRDLRTPTAPGRRVAGAVDLDDPACVPATYVAGNDATGPCDGPFVTSEGLDKQSAGSSSSGTSALQLAGIDAGGSRVLFYSAAFQRPLNRNVVRAGFYVADVRPGVPRKSGVRLALVGVDPPSGARLAADGRHVAFASEQIAFDGLQPVGRFPSGTVPTLNVFSADLDARTVERTTTAADGGEYQTTLGAARAPVGVFSSADGSVATFAAPDGNLFVGDANGVNDVLVVRTAPAPTGRGDRVLPIAGPLPPVDLTRPEPLASRFVATLGRVAVSTRTGTATLKVSVPVGGTLVGTARGTAKRTTGTGGRRRTTTSTVAVGTARRTLKGSATTTLTIAVGAKARAALRRSPFRLAVRLELEFRPLGAAPTTAVRTYTLKRSYLAPTRREAAAKRKAAAKRRDAAARKAEARRRASTTRRSR